VAKSLGEVLHDFDPGFGFGQSGLSLLVRLLGCFPGGGGGLSAGGEHHHKPGDEEAHNCGCRHESDRLTARFAILRQAGKTGPSNELSIGSSLFLVTQIQQYSTTPGFTNAG
jgi:hypothetical protein